MAYVDFRQNWKQLEFTMFLISMANARICKPWRVTTRADKKDEAVSNMSMLFCRNYDLRS